MAQESSVEERDVSKDEIKAGVELRAGHKVTLIIGGSSHPPHPGGEPGPQPGGEPGPDTPGQTTDQPPDPPQPDGPGPKPVPDKPPKLEPAPTPHDALDVTVLSAAGAPQKNVEWEIALPDGTRRAGRTGGGGTIHLENLPPKAQCTLDLPDLDVEKTEAAAAAGRVRYQKDLALQAGTNSQVELPPRVRSGKLTGLHFETAKTFLLPSAMTGIRTLRALYDTFGADLSVLVSGHTDTQGGADFNRGLSDERADSISRFLTDDADGWMKFYNGQPFSDPWGVREDQFMLSTLKDSGGAPFLAGKVDGALGPKTQAAYQKFQSGQGLNPTGLPNRDTRRALVTQYLALDRTSLPPGAKLAAHGCGFTHLAVQTGPNVDEPQNRRVEIYLFEGEVAPAPRAKCPPGGCPEYPQWVARTQSSVDLDAPPGSFVAQVVDESGAPVAGAAVHVSGLLAQDQQTGADGAARFDALVAGKYQVIADKDGFTAADAQIDVVSGGAASATLTLQAGVFDLPVLVEDRKTPPGPLAGAQVTIDAPGAAPQTTGADGIALFLKVPRGTFNLTATHDGFVQSTVQIEVPVAQAVSAGSGGKALADAPVQTKGPPPAPGGPAQPPPAVIKLASAVVTKLKVRVRTRAGRKIAGATVKLTAPAQTVTTGNDGIAILSINETERAALSPADTLEITVGKRHHGPHPGASGAAAKNGEVKFTQQLSGAGFKTPDPIIDKDGVLEIELIDGGYAFAALTSGTVTRRLSDDEVQNELMMHHLLGRIDLDVNSEFVFDHDPSIADFDPCVKGQCKLKNPPASHWVFLKTPMISGVTFFALMNFGAVDAAPTKDKIPGHHFVKETFTWANTALQAIDQRHLVGLVRLCKQLREANGVVAIYTQGVSGSSAGKTLPNGKVIFDCHTYGRALDFGGMSTAMPDPKNKAPKIRLGTDFIVFLHWGKVPMWQRTSVAANPTTPASWTRLTSGTDDGFDYATAGTTSRLHYRLDPAAFQDAVPALAPPDPALSTALGQVAPHFTSAATLFKAVYDFAVKEYSDSNIVMGPVTPPDPAPTPIDSHSGHFVLFPDYPHPNNPPDNSNGRGAHINHLHFQVGPTSYAVTRSV